MPEIDVIRGDQVKTNRFGNSLRSMLDNRGMVDKDAFRTRLMDKFNKARVEEMMADFDAEMKKLKKKKKKKKKKARDNPYR